MIEIHETPYYSIFHDQEHDANIIRWTDKVLILNEKNYKTGITEAFNKINQKKATYLIIDNTDAVYPITETIQEWIVENIFPLTKHYKKIIYIYSKDFLTSQNIEEIIQKFSNIETNQKRYLASSLKQAYELLHTN